MNNKELTQKNLKIVKETLENIANMSEQEFRKMIDAMAQFSDYSLRNQIILWLDDCSQVASFKQWKEQGRKVKKGAKATWILAPSFKTITKKDEITGEEEKKKILNYFVSVPVFDIAQTEGKPVERNMTIKSDIAFAKVEKAAEELGYIVGYSSLSTNMGGYICEEGIFLNSNLNQIENTATLIHELAHGELGHLESRNLSTKSQKEQEAEMVTAIVCKHFGIVRKSEFYLKCWSTNEKILKSFEEINKVSTRIIEKLGEK